MIEIIPNWHPLFVHFTVALFSLSIIFFIVQRPLAETEIGDNFLVFARYSLWLGILFSVATLIAGFDAYNTVDHDTPSHTAMTDHKNWALATLTLFFVASIWAVVSRVSEKASVVFLAFLLIGGGLLVTTGHKGSLLVYQYGLGVESLPAKDDHKSGGGHDHDHGDGGHGAEKSTSGGHDDAHSHGTSHESSKKSDDGHDHDHSEMKSSADMDMGGETMQSPEPAPDDMKMDLQMIEPDVSVLDKLENIVPKVAHRAAKKTPKIITQPKVDVVMQEEPKALKESKEPELVVEAEANESNTFLIQTDDGNSFLIPKIEKYDDGTIRETLPAVTLDTQE